MSHRLYNVDHSHRRPSRRAAALNPVARMFRDARIGKNIPVAEELGLAHIARHELGLPKSH